MHRNLLTGPSLPFLYYAAGRERKEDEGGDHSPCVGKVRWLFPRNTYCTYCTQRNFPEKIRGHFVSRNLFVNSERCNNVFKGPLASLPCPQNLGSRIFFPSTYLICRLSSGELAKNSGSAPSWPHAQFYAAGGLFYRGFRLACQGGARCLLATTRIQIRGERTRAGRKFDGFFI